MIPLGLWELSGILGWGKESIKQQSQDLISSSTGISLSHGFPPVLNRKDSSFLAYKCTKLLWRKQDHVYESIWNTIKNSSAMEAVMYYWVAELRVKWSLPKTWLWKRQFSVGHSDGLGVCGTCLCAVTTRHRGSNVASICICGVLVIRRKNGPAHKWINPMWN